MKVVESVGEMVALSDAIRRDGSRIGLVPTMGYLHEGHLSLVRESAARGAVTVVSIFVNPVQFGANEDFSTYPRDFGRDCRLCREAGVAVVFSPPPEAMYAADRSVLVEERALASGLCGASRPGHFAGVCTVVAKLFNIVRPDLAVFGQKDAQQLAVIRRMVRDLDFQVEIVGAPIVREADGLAMSSRNVYLSAAERGQALGLNRVLAFAAGQVRDGLRDAGRLREAMMAFLAGGYPGVEVDYIAIVDGETLVPQASVTGGTLLALAARVGRTRLIDNLTLEPGTGNKIARDA
jgi:pantoate--beta-alanine ligase